MGNCFQHIEQVLWLVFPLPETLGCCLLVFMLADLMPNVTITSHYWTISTNGTHTHRSTGVHIFIIVLNFLSYKTASEAK